jgi:hypothetical protein
MCLHQHKNRFHGKEKNWIFWRVMSSWIIYIQSFENQWTFKGSMLHPNFQNVSWFSMDCMKLFLTTTVRASNPTLAYSVDDIYSHFYISNIYHSYQWSQTNFIRSKMRIYICTYFPGVEEAKYTAQNGHHYKNFKSNITIFLTQNLVSHTKVRWYNNNNVRHFINLQMMIILWRIKEINI